MPGNSGSPAVDAAGRVYLDGHPVADELLRQRIRAAKKKDAKLRAVIAADGSAQHRQVVGVIDLLRQEGVVRFAINVQPEDLTTQQP